MSVENAMLSGRVTITGDDLFYEVRGQGTPLLMIAPGGGDGWQYAQVAERLADTFRVITFDRRANGRSTLNPPQNFSIRQQSEDALAVLRAVGEETAFVFGNSSGAVIALDLATAHPECVRAVVAHEGPMARLHPRSARWQRFFAEVYLTSFTFGPAWAALQFMLGAQLPVQPMIKASRGVTAHRKASADPYLSSQTATEVLIRLELLPVTSYLPDVAALRRSGVRVCLGVSEWGVSKRAWYVEVARQLLEQLGCALVTFPDHHGAFLDRPAEFADALRATLTR
ncbi:MAG: alpha/beta hydrolase [Anaerolineales bacterium]|nr:alpha/beta hydrolase [Anaerolineales bacterium]